MNYHFFHHSRLLRKGKCSGKTGMPLAASYKEASEGDTLRTSVEGIGIKGVTWYRFTEGKWVHLPMDTVSWGNPLPIN